MALQLIVDSLDTVPESLHGEYTEKDGKFHLNVEGVEDTTSLKTALNSERQLRAKYEKQAKAWEKTGKSPDEIAELLEEQRKKDEEAARKAGDFDAILKQHQDKHAKELSDRDAELTAARASEREAVVGERVSSALARLGATEEGIELLPDRLANRIKFETVNGKRVLKIVQADGETPMAGSGADGTATIDDLVKEATTKYPSLFKANSGGGGGKPPETPGGGKPPAGGVPASLAECKTDEQKAAYLKAKREQKGS